MSDIARMMAQAVPPTRGYNPSADLAETMQTGVNLPGSALTGTPYDLRTIYVHPDQRMAFEYQQNPLGFLKDLINNLGSQRPYQTGQAVDIDINAIMQSYSGATNQDQFTRPENYRAIDNRLNTAMGGGVNGRSPSAMPTLATPGIETDNTPSSGGWNRAAQDKSNGKSWVPTEKGLRQANYVYGGDALQGSTAMRTGYNTQTADDVRQIGNRRAAERQAIRDEYFD